MFSESVKLLSVGIDVGSSTSHLVFSRLILRRERFNYDMSNRYLLVNRQLVYEGQIIFTPLLDKQTIDLEKLVKFFEEEYRRAGITPDQVDTGGVIVTGETAKKQNAAEIVQRISSKSGKFVSAAAGPNFEALLAARGSGIVDLSREKHNAILNVDIGGGSSKLAIASNGEVRSTSSINIGGRLLGIDPGFKIWRLDNPAIRVMQQLGMHYQVGDIIPEKHVLALARAFALALVEVMRGPTTSPIAKTLMITSDLDFAVPVDAISFSGGVSEFIYQLINSPPTDVAAERSKNLALYLDIGYYLAEALVELKQFLKASILEPENKIRATVIGAGAFSFSISGSTCYHSASVSLPVTNIPVISIPLSFSELLLKREDQFQKVQADFSRALTNYNLVDGEDLIALFFNDITIRANLGVFARFVAQLLHKYIMNKKLVTIVLGFDGARMLGVTFKNETDLKDPLFCLDEVYLESGDWIDIGKPLGDQQAFPVTIKNLVFNRKVPVTHGTPGGKSTPR